MNWSCMFCGRENFGPVRETQTCACGEQFTLTMVPSRLLAVEPGKREFKHGRSGYMNRRCRCEICKTEGAAYFREYKQRNAVVGGECRR